MRGLCFVVLAGCSFAADRPPPGEQPDAAAPDAGEPACSELGETPATIATATAAGEYVLELPAQASSATSWAEVGNEAVILEIATARRGLIGHLVLLQGSARFGYGMHLGALEAGEQVTAVVSALSSEGAPRAACVGAGTLRGGTELGAIAEGLPRAPIFRWPVQKRFSDLPVLLGWSKARSEFQTVFTNEDGGTTKLCGGGAQGVRSEIARWGRAADIEGNASYGGATPRWMRCTGSSSLALRVEGQHPILYYGDGHNRLFESRGGYGQTCGAGAAEKANGDLAGWNTSNPGNDLANDAGRVLILRPAIVELDALDYPGFGGRREALIDRGAPWLYRITAHELAREGKLDGNQAFDMARYLYVDVRVANVDGNGDSYCSTSRSGGFKLRAQTTGGQTIEGPQITAEFAANGAHDWKRVALELPAGTRAADIASFSFDAFDGDGIYVTGLGDAFVPVPDGAAGAVLEYVRQGTKALALYVDDNSSGCVGGTTNNGPGGTAYSCSGGVADLGK